MVCLCVCLLYILMTDRCPKHSVSLTCHYTSEFENLSNNSVHNIFSLKGSFNISKVPIAILSNVKWNLMHMCCSSVSSFLKNQSHRAQQSHFIMMHTVTLKSTANDSIHSTLLPEEFCTNCTGAILQPVQSSPITPLIRKRFFSYY